MEPPALSRVVDRAIATDPSLRGCSLSEGARGALLAAADGDARVALNTLELAAGSVARATRRAADSTPATAADTDATGAAASAPEQGSSCDAAVGGSWEVDKAAVQSAVQRRVTYYDRNGTRATLVQTSNRQPRVRHCRAWLLRACPRQTHSILR